MTLTEQVEAAVSELRLTRAGVAALTTLVAERLSQKATEAQVIINNYARRDPVRVLFVDPVSGSDANNGGLETPFKTIDKAIDERYTDGFTEINCFGDVVIRKYHSVFTSVTVAGATRNTPDNSLPYVGFQRSLSFASEASNSPSAAFGRLVAGFNMIGNGSLGLKNLSIMLADPSAQVVFAAHITSGGEVNCQAVDVAAPSAGSRARLIYAPPGYHASLWFSGSLGTNAPGKVFSGVSAGANPNGGSYSSNLVSA